jgi:hypothetical protein
MLHEQEHGPVADYARKMTKAAPNAVAELTQEQRRQRQERLDRELRAVEADHESIVHAMYPHPENGTCFGEINIITQVCSFTPLPLHSIPSPAYAVCGGACACAVACACACACAVVRVRVR